MWTETFEQLVLVVITGDNRPKIHCRVEFAEGLGRQMMSPDLTQNHLC